SPAARREAIWLPPGILALDRQRRRQVVVGGAWSQTTDEHVVAIGCRCRIGNRHVGGSGVIEVVFREAPVHLGMLDVLESVPANRHAIVAMVREANLRRR